VANASAVISAKCEDGKYYLQSGHTDYRVFQIDGLDKLVRSNGTVSVTAAQALSAQANNERTAATKLEPKFVSVVEVGTEEQSCPRLQSSWPGGLERDVGQARSSRYPYVQVKAVRADDRLLPRLPRKGPVAMGQPRHRLDAAFQDRRLRSISSFPPGPAGQAGTARLLCPATSGC